MKGSREIFKSNDNSLSTDNLLDDLNVLQNRLAKNSSMLEHLGGKRRGSKKSSKGSKKSSKGSKKGSSGGGAKKLHPALVESNKTVTVVSERLGVKRSPGLIKFVNQRLRIPAKGLIKDEKDYKAINKKMLELLDDLLAKKSKQQLVVEVEKFAEEVKNARRK